MKIISLDVGEKRIGVAQGDTDTRIAVPVGCIPVDGNELKVIARYAKIRNTNYFVIGLPRSNEGNETAQSQYVRKFVESFLTVFPEAKIQFQDESLTSVEAENRLKARKKKIEKGEIDAEAAAVILQDFFEGQGAKTNSKEGRTSVDGKKKSKKWLKLTSVFVILGIIGVTGVIGGLLLRDKIQADRLAEYARLEEEANSKMFDFTILPGETVFDVKQRLLDYGYPEDEVAAALNPQNYTYAFLNGLDSLEGYLYGETFRFTVGTEATTVIDEFLAKMEKVIAENKLEARYAEKGLTLHEGVILASIVQKEAKTADMPTVAQVFLTRLDYGIKLGSDVTVSYALDVADQNRTVYNNNDAALGIDSCYNTRLYAGLPCGAISNPGIAALEAVANPSETTYLYFLTGDDGMMYYSYTEAEHIQNITEHCQELCQTAL